MSLLHYLDARNPVTFVVTYEERRVVEEIKAGWPESATIHTWTATHGLDECEPGGGDPEVILRKIIEDKGADVVYVLHDFHVFLKNPIVGRSVRDLATRAHTIKEARGVERPGHGLAEGTVHVVLTAPSADGLPPDLRGDVPIVDLGRPTRQRLQAITEKARAAHPGDEPPELATALAGLTVGQARLVLALTVAEHGEVRVNNVLKAKATVLAADVPGLEIVTPDVTLDDVAGLDALVDWIRATRAVIQDPDAAKAFGLPAPKGLLLCGVPGGGKSLTAKALASGFGLGLLRLDLGAMMGSLVGQSESQIRRALQVAEAMAPVVLWADELEKAVSQGQIGASGDSGTSSRVIGTFISWMSEKTAPVFLVATANRPEILPPELLRKGRFDEMFAIDLPDAKGRAAIFVVHLKKRKRDVETFDLQALAKATEGYSGAEIEAVVLAGLRRCFVEEKRPLTTEDLLAEVAVTVPLSKSMAGEIENMRSWARGRARAASGKATTTPSAAKAGLGF